MAKNLFRDGERCQHLVLKVSAHGVAETVEDLATVARHAQAENAVAEVDDFVRLGEPDSDVG